MNSIYYKILLSLGIVVAILLVRWFVNSFLLPRIVKPKHHYAWRKTIIYLSSILILISLIALWLEDFGEAATFLGLLSAGLAVALKDPIVNLFGWFHIIFNRPFEVGHRIEIGAKKGDVLDITFFEFTLLEIGEYVDSSQSTGRIIHIPNGKVFTQPVVNAVQGFQYIWNEIPVLITFKSNWEKAKELLLSIERDKVSNIDTLKKDLTEGERRYNVHYNILTPTVYTSVKASGVQLTLRFLCHPKRQRATEQMIWEEILKTFNQETDIEFAYDSVTVYVEKN